MIACSAIACPAIACPVIACPVMTVKVVPVSRLTLLHQDVNEFGIVQGHAYGILRVEQETDQFGVHRLIQVRG